MGGQLANIGTAALTEQQFRQWRTMFEHMTGLGLSPEREQVARAVLAARLEVAGCDCAGYLQRLQRSPSFSRREWDAVIEALVIGETRFFRYSSVFAFAARYLSERCLIEKRLSEERHSSTVASRITAWSAGCSTGEEAFSLAMLLHRLCRPGSGSPGFAVIGTDINGRSLKQASRGVYRNIRQRGVDDNGATAFFEVLGDGSYRVRDFLRAKVSFFRHNLLEPVASALIPPMDLISCQNVLMYLQPWRRRAVIRHLVAFLKVDGVLMLCPGDLSGWKPDNLERVEDTGVQAYRRRY